MIDPAYDCRTPLREIFSFKTEEDAIRMAEYVTKIKDKTSYKILKDLKIVKSSKGITGSN